MRASRHISVKSPANPFSSTYDSGWLEHWTQESSNLSHGTGVSGGWGVSGADKEGASTRPTIRTLFQGIAPYSNVAQHETIFLLWILRPLTYPAAEEDELGLVEGCTVTHIEFIDEGWWMGQYNGDKGMFPASYVDIS